MYQPTFLATDDADWAQAIELINDETNEPLADAEDAEFTLSVKDADGDIVLSASTDAATITKPDTHIIAWRFTAAQMGGLCEGRTYRVGCNMTTDEGTTALFVGSLVLIDGDVN